MIEQTNQLDSIDQTDIRTRGRFKPAGLKIFNRFQKLAWILVFVWFLWSLWGAIGSIQDFPSMIRSLHSTAATQNRLIDLYNQIGMPGKLLVSLNPLYPVIAILNLASVLSAIVLFWRGHALAWTLAVTTGVFAIIMDLYAIRSVALLSLIFGGQDALTEIRGMIWMPFVVNVVLTALAIGAIIHLRSPKGVSTNKPAL